MDLDSALEEATARKTEALSLTGLKDADIPKLQDWLSKNSFVTHLNISQHALTPASFRPLLSLIKKNTSILSFDCDMIMPLSAGNGDFYQACQRLITKNKALAKDKPSSKEILYTFLECKEERVAAQPQPSKEKDKISALPPEIKSFLLSIGDDEFSKLMKAVEEERALLKSMPSHVAAAKAH